MVSFLGHDFMGGSCKRSRVCEIQGCTTTHHRFIHIKAESPNQKQTVRTKVFQIMVRIVHKVG